MFASLVSRTNVHKFRWNPLCANSIWLNIDSLDLNRHELSRKSQRVPMHADLHWSFRALTNDKHDLYALNYTSILFIWTSRLPVAISIFFPSHLCKCLNSIHYRFFFLFQGLTSRIALGSKYIVVIFTSWFAKRDIQLQIRDNNFVQLKVESVCVSSASQR